MIQFPDSPSNGQIENIAGNKYTWNSTKNCWESSYGLDSATIVTALGFTPYSAANPEGFISTVTYVNPTSFYYNARTVSTNKTIASTENALSVGPITIADGVSVTIEDGGEWAIV